jgi:hypothetical protein
VLVAGFCGSAGSGLPGRASPVGPVCGSDDIIGEVIASIDGPGGCGVRGAVRVHSVAGVALAPHPTITCGTARALERWIAGGAQAAAARLQARLTGLDVADHYACRGRNRARTGRLSEHASGRAIDISAFRLAGGQVVTVAGDWNDERYGPMLRRIHAAGCGPFRTTLGPGSDGFHEDHLHYDIERRRGGGAHCR